MYDRDFERLKNARRRFSDDYDQMERGIPCGEDFSIRIGDVNFTLRHSKYSDAESVSIYVDGMYVGSYQFGMATRWEEEFDLPALRIHVRTAVREVIHRMEKYERERMAEEARHKAGVRNHRMSLIERFKRR